MDKLRSAILSDYSAFGPEIVSTLVECSSQVPLKTHVYAQLAAALHSSENKDIVPAWVSRLRHMIIEKLASFAPNPMDSSSKDQVVQKRTNLVAECEIVVGLRFLASLVSSKLISPSSWFDFVLSFLANLESFQSKNVKDFIISAILSTFIHNGRNLNEHLPLELQALFDRLVARMNARAVEPLVFASALNQEDALQDLWERILRLKEKAWVHSYLPNVASIHDFSDSAIVLAPLTDEELAPLFSAVMPSCNVEGCKFSLKDPVEDGVTVGYDSASIERWYVRELVHRSFVLCSHNHTKLSESLLSFYKYFEGHADLIERYIIEAIVRDMLNMSNRAYPWVSYSCVIIDLLNMKPDIVAKPLGEVIHMLFYRLPHLLPSQRRLVARWFAHHLSHFDFVWNWDLWHRSLAQSFPQGFELSSESAALPAPKITHPELTVQFVKMLIQELIRFSYYDRVKAIIPSYFAHLLPPPVQPTPLVLPDASLEDFKKELEDAMKTREPSETVDSLLLSMPQVPDIANCDKKVFLECLLSLGNKSFSHTLNISERYVDILKRLATSDEEKTEMMKIISAYWVNQPQYIELIFDKYVNYQIFSAIDIAAYTLHCMKTDSDSLWTWNVLNTCLTKIIREPLLYIAQFMGLLQVAGILNDGSTEAAYDQIPIIEFLFHECIRDASSSLIHAFMSLSCSSPVAALITNQHRYYCS